ncbi:hypothetical protein ALC57_05604 [Trachymyrmex cornetzi]|uniref:Double jelly roll-like domain-containing protein n=1 Tax=Trachymyrmex cornetzi TaxID=471704 RepID=A0A151JAH0_9HYME|nr:hypothetical protein ALC57_05604 [Trachymyrmex cornetzi]
MDVTSGSSLTSKISSTEGTWSYDKSGGCGISDISFKVDGTVFERFNTDFTGVEACIGLSYRALGCFLLGFGSSSFTEKNVSFMLGSLEDSTVFSTICFSGSIIANVVERLTKSCDKRASLRTLGSYEGQNEDWYGLENKEEEEEQEDSSDSGTRRYPARFTAARRSRVIVAKVVNDSKAAQRQLEELQRHNRVMEGRGVYLAPYKRGRGGVSSVVEYDQAFMAVKTATQLEEPRYVIYALQTGRKNIMSQDVSVFDDCNLSNVKVYLNSDFYPYGDLNLDFDKKRYALLFDMYARFRKAYYGIDSFETLLNVLSFIEKGPFAVIDCSRRNESALQNVFKIFHWWSRHQEEL